MRHGALRLSSSIESVIAGFKVLFMGKKLFVGNLPFSVSEDDIAQAFTQAGSVDSVKIIVDRDTGRSKGFGFVEMSTDDAAKAAIDQMNGFELDGRRLTVNEARPMEGGRGGGGGYRGGGGGRSFDGGGRRDRG